jgi:hypothetical protein
MGQPARFNGFRALNLLAATTITTAVTDVATTPITDLIGMTSVMVQAAFDHGSGGTNVVVYLQTSLDFGASWFDIANWTFTTSDATRIMSMRATTAVAANLTPTSGTLTANTLVDGLLGDRLRLLYSSTGTYAGSTTLTVTGLSKGGW